MVGLVEAAPVYLNGLAALLFVFLLPGAALGRIFPSASFSQRWLTALLASLTINYVVVVLIAQFKLDPVLAYRSLAAVASCGLLYTMLRRDGAALSRWELGSLLGAVVVLSFTYSGIWKHGVPNVFHGGDVSVSWDVWALIWAKSNFPTASYGYPQFVPALWAVTYIFTGADIQYFAYYIYIVLIIVPLVLTCGIVSRSSAWLPAAALLTYAWFIAEVQHPWLKNSFEEGYPDWVAAIFCLCGVLLFVSGPTSEPDEERPARQLLSLWMLLIAASTKPLNGLFALAVLTAVCTEAARYLQPPTRNRIIVAAVGLVLVFAAAYVTSYSHLVVRSMPNYPVAALSDRLWRAIGLFNSSFTVAFRLMILAGLVLCPFLPRVRWLLLPLLIGLGVWANTASYDLRNALGFLLVSAFIPAYAAVRALKAAPIPLPRQSWMPDGAVLAGVAVVSFVFTLPLAMADRALQERFATDQMRGGWGLEVNQKISDLLKAGCTIFDSDGYILTISALRPYRDQIQFFHYPEPLSPAFIDRFNRPVPCRAVAYPPEAAHATILDFLRQAETDGRYRKAETSERNLLVLQRVAD